MNTLKNLTKKAIAVGSGMLVLGGTLAGVAAASDLHNYPAPFIQNGQFNGLIVVGEKAATSDVLGSIEIASSLQAASTTVVTQGGGSTTGMTGDVKLIGDSARSLEIGQKLGEVTAALTNDDLQMLKSGTVSTRNLDTDFTQTLTFAGSATFPSSGATSNLVPAGSVGLTENNDYTTGVYLFFKDNQPLFKYDLEFTSGLQSDIDADNNAKDILDENIFMMGQYFSVVKAHQTGTGPYGLDLTLISGAVTDTLEQGMTRTYTVNGKQYEVTVLAIGTSGSATTTKLLVNGEATQSLQKGDTDKVAGIDVGVRDIIQTTAYRANDPGSIVEFYIGANKLEFQKDNIASAGQDGSVKVNGASVSEATVDIQGSDDGSTMRINKITYVYSANALTGNRDVFLTKGQGLRQFIDKPAGLLADQWDVVYQGLSAPATTNIAFTAQGDDTYDLEFTNRRGDHYVVPYAYQVDSSTAPKFGDEQDDLIFWEQKHVANANLTPQVTGDYNIKLDSYFVLTQQDNPTGTGATAFATDNADTYVLRFKNVNRNDHTIIFDDASTNTETTSTYDLEMGQSSIDDTSAYHPATGTINIGGREFKFWMYENGAGSNEYHLAVDLNGDTHYAKNSAARVPVDIVAKGGGAISLSDDPDTLLDTAGSKITTAPGTAWTATLFTNGRNTNSRNDQAESIGFNSASSGSSKIDIGSSSVTADTTDAANTVLQRQRVRNEQRTQYLDAYGAMFDLTTSTSESNSLTIAYPSEQVLPMVYVTGANVQTTVGAPAGSAVVVNPLGVGFSVLDSQVSDVQFNTKNMIVVGGPCVNTVAAKLLNNPADCTEGFAQGKAMLKLFDNGQRVALLVAGYSAQDTQGASRAIAQSGDYTLSGMEADLTVASVNSVMVSTGSTTTMSNSTQ